MAGGVNGNAAPAGLGRALDRGVAGGFNATEKAVFGVVSAAGVHVYSKFVVHVCSKFASLARGALGANVAGEGGLGGTGGELVYGKGLFLGRSAHLRRTWGPRATMVHRWRGKNPRANGVLYSWVGAVSDANEEKLRRDNIQISTTP